MKTLIIAATLSAAGSLYAQTKAPDHVAESHGAASSSPGSSPGSKVLAAAAVNGAAGPRAKAPAAPPSAPVVTLSGVCGERKEKSACRTVISREDLDRFTRAVAPQASESARRALAVQYAQTVAFSALAEELGLQKDPVLASDIERQLQLVRMRILASAYMQRVQAQPGVLPDVLIEKYYNEHRNEFEEARLYRVSIPIALLDQDGHHLDRAAVKAEMDEIRKRALAGEELAELQKDAYKGLRISMPPPAVSAVPMRRSGLYGDEAKAFDMAPGEFSPVLDLPAAVVFFKLESKDALPLSTVRPEVQAAVQRARVQEQLTKRTSKIKAQFDLQYLQMSAQPDIFSAAAVAPAVTREAARRPARTPRPAAPVVK